MLEVDIKELLGAPALSEQKSDEVVEQLARINEQLVIKNRRAHRIWKTIGIIFAVFVAVNVLLVLLALFLFGINTSSSSMEEESVVEIEAECEE